MLLIGFTLIVVGFLIGLAPNIAGIAQIAPEVDFAFTIVAIFVIIFGGGFAIKGIKVAWRRIT